jgi:two-component system sensor histidine kinase KdpD
MACVATALIAMPLRQYFDVVNIVMLFLLTVFLVSLRLGQGPAVLAAFFSVALFDFFFVPPHLTFAVADAQYLLTFAVMLVVALITGQLTAGLKQQAETASLEEHRTRALYEMAKALSGAMRLTQVVEISCEFLRDAVRAEAVLLIPDDTGELQPHGTCRVWYEPHLAMAAFDDGLHPFPETDGVRYYPLTGSTRIRGVMAVSPLDGATLNENHPLLEAVASLVAIAIERLHYVDVAQQAQVQMASERLRSSVLSALSHDLRTPLTILVGLADSLAMSRPPLAAKQKETAEAVLDQSLRLCGLVENLLDMARLHAGEVKLRREWQPLEEVVGASLKLLERSLVEHPLRVDLPADLPLLEFDAVLIERVLCNLLENAAKYSPLGSAIEIAARQNGAMVEVSVSDHGSGIPPGRQDRIFDMFVRGVPESPTPGVGLGLAICRAIVEAHGGTIVATNRTPSGACFTFTLPVGNPPVIDEETLLPEGAL